MCAGSCGSLMVDAGVFLDSPCYLLRQGLSGTWTAQTLASAAGQLTLCIPVFVSQVLGLQLAAVSAPL